MELAAISNGAAIAKTIVTICSPVANDYWV